MGNKFGAMSLPAAAPEGHDDALTDPALDVIADFFATVIATHLGTAWKAYGRREPIIRTVKKFDPEEQNFSADDLPALYLWRESEPPTPTHDALQEAVSMLTLLWVPPPATQIHASKRDGFFNGFCKCIKDAVLKERDLSWVRDGDESSGATVYGSSVIDQAEISGWSVGECSRSSILVPIEDSPGKGQVYRAYQVTLTVREFDRPVYTPETTPGLAPTSLDFQLTTAGADPFVLQHEREPDT